MVKERDSTMLTVRTDHPVGQRTCTSLGRTPHMRVRRQRRVGCRPCRVVRGDKDMTVLVQISGDLNGIGRRMRVIADAK